MGRTRVEEKAVHQTDGRADGRMDGRADGQTGTSVHHKRDRRMDGALHAMEQIGTEAKCVCLGGWTGGWVCGSVCECAKGRLRNKDG